MVNGCSVERTKHAGFDAILLKNRFFQLVIVPELGGKIASIVHLASQREWLWTNPHLTQQSVQYDGDYVESFDTGGFDECFPAVAPGPYPNFPWEGIPIPDHGELWCQPWEAEIVASSQQQISLKTGCHGVRFPYQFERTITITADQPLIQLDYQVANQTNFEMPFVWSSHPLINIEEGMRLTLPTAIDTVRLEGGINNHLGENGELIRWPITNETDISLVPAPSFGRAYKIFTPTLKGNSVVETAIHDPSGQHALTFRFSPQQIYHIGIWMNYGAWSGSGSTPYFNLGLEPCIGSKDRLDEAKEIGEFGLLPAKSTQHWTLEIELS